MKILSQSYKYVKEQLAWVNTMEESNEHPILEQLSNPKPSPFPDTSVEKNEKKEPIPISPTIIDKFAPKMGYVKKPTIEPENVRQFKIAILTFIILVLGDLIIFFSNAIDPITLQWALTPKLWQVLIMAVIKDTSVGLVGKILKYYNKSE